MVASSRVEDPSFMMLPMNYTQFSRFLLAILLYFSHMLLLLLLRLVDFSASKSFRDELVKLELCKHLAWIASE